MVFLFHSIRYIGDFAKKKEWILLSIPIKVIFVILLSRTQRAPLPAL